jgi:hypothetical protein
MFTVGVSNVIKYHKFWAQNENQYNSFEGNLIEISDYLKTVPENYNKVVIARNMQIIPIKLFNSELPNTYRAHPDNLDNITKEISNKNKNLFILTEKEEWMAEKILNSYPNLELIKHKGKFGEAFWIIK